jgi:hypothetical protein
MRASSAAFHRSWWRRRTGFIADMYGDVVRSRRFLLRGNSWCRQWRAGVGQVRGAVGSESEVAREAERSKATTVFTAGQQYEVAVWVQSRLSQVGSRQSQPIVRGPDLTAFPDKLELDPL